MFRPFGQGDVIVLIVAGIGVCGARRRALHILIAIAVMTLLIWPFKIGVGRERPAFHNFQSFPSGDAATAAAFVTPLAGISPWSLPTAILITGGVASERVYYGRHYASDVLSGVGFGILASAIALGVMRRWRWCPERIWFAVVGFLIMAMAGISLFRPHGAPYMLRVLQVWGSLGMFLVLSHLIPIWLRKRGTKVRIQSTPPSAGGFRMWVLFTAISTGGWVLVIMPWFMPIFGLRIPLTATGLTALFMAHALRRHRHRRPEAMLPITLAGGACLILSFAISILPAFHAYRASILTF